MEHDTSTDLARRMVASVRKAGAQALVNEITRGWEGAPPIVVFHGSDDPQLKHLKLAGGVTQALNDHRKSASGEPAQGPLLFGMQSHGVVYLNSAASTDPREIVATILHECVGHHGLRGAFGKSLNAALSDICRLRPKDVESKRLQYKLSDSVSGRLIAAEEVLADLAETNPRFGPVRKATAAIATWVRSNIPAMRHLRLTQAEIVRDFILPARQYVQSGAARSQSTHQANPQPAGNSAPSTIQPARPSPQALVRASFIGEQAAAADLFSLQHARARLADGADASTVLAETGWRKGADSKWRFEISDDEATLKVKAYKGYSLGPVVSEWIRKNDRSLTMADLLDHPKLFAAYPALASYPVSFGPRREALGGANGSLSGKNIWISDDLDNRQVLSTLMHEVQHGIQAVEGFATGGTPGVAAWVVPSLRPALLKQVSLSLQSLTPPTYEQYWGQERTEEGLRAYKAFVKEWDSPAYQRKMELAVQQGAPAIVYHQLYGEVEARNTQTRLRMTAQQRAQTPPMDTQDVPDADAVLLFNGQEMASAVIPAPPIGLRDERAVRDAVLSKFPSLSGSIDAMLERGRAGQRGGLVVIESSSPLDMARVYAEKTGRTLSQALTAFGIDLTDTPAFQAWFGDSKIIDEDGAPKPVYHGTTATRTRLGTSSEPDLQSRALLQELQALADAHGIEEASSVPSIFERWLFMGQAADRGVTPELAVHARDLLERSRIVVTPPTKELAFSAFEMPSHGKELGSHFGTEAQASGFGDVFPFYLSIKKPLRLPDLGTWNYQSVMREARKRGVPITEQEYDQVFNARDNNAALRELLQGKGFDGVVYRNEAEGRGDSYIAFNAEQIKSSDENNGEFSPLDKDFRRSEIPRPTAPPTHSKAFNEWFDGSKIAHPDGQPIVAYHGTGKDFTEFKDGHAFFSGNPEIANTYAKVAGNGGRVMPVYLSIKNPIRLDFLAPNRPSWFANKRRVWMNKGYDGAIIGEDVFIAFTPGQVKSAIGNSGQFDASKPDIRLSEAPAFGRESSLWANTPADDKLMLQGFSDELSGLSFVVAPNLTARSAPAVVLHEVAHSQQRADLDAKAQALLDNPADQPEPTRQFLERVQARLSESGQLDNPQEAMPYIVELAALEGHQEGFSRVGGRFLNWVESTFGAPVGGIVRGFAALVGATGLRFGLNKSPTIDDFVALAKMGVHANARGHTVGGWGLRASQVISGLRSDVQSTGFFSALARGINAVKETAMTGAQWMERLRSLVNKGLVKQDEIYWTGLDEWLKATPGKIAKADVKEYIEENAVDVRETILDDATPQYSVVRDETEEEYPWAVMFEGKLIDNFPSQAEASVYMERLVKQEKRTTKSKFKQYTPDGGSNYRELLLTLPGNWSPVEGLAGPQHFQSKHWSQANVLAHVRFDERTSLDGKRVLFVSEIQSDWAQDAKQTGFAKPFDMAMPRIEAKQMSVSTFVQMQGLDEHDWLDGRNAMRTDLGLEPMTMGSQVMVVSENGKPKKVLDAFTTEADAQGAHTSAWARMINDARRQHNAGQRDKLPPAPFITTTDGWTTLAIKRLVKLAADEGFDQIAFISGQQCHDMFSLVNTAQYIEYDVASGTLDVEGNDGTSILANHRTSPEDLHRYIGKELAARLLQSSPVEGVHRLDSESLKVRGAGMKAFYDHIIPNAAKSVLRKLGGEGLRKVEIKAVPKYDFAVEHSGVGNQYVLRDRNTNMYLADARYMTFAHRAEDGHLQPSLGVAKKLASALCRIPEQMEQIGFDITDAMRERLSGGQPLFSKLRQDRFGQTGPDGLGSNAPSPAVPDPFTCWSRSLPVVTDPKAQYQGGPAVFVSYHGTTHTDIIEFKRMGHQDGFLGKGPYFTSSSADASSNYACIGPDLTNNLVQYKERTAENLDDFAMKELLESFYDAHPDTEPYTGWDEDCTDEAWDEHGDQALEHDARCQLVGKSEGLVMKAYVRLTNPADTTGGKRTTDLTYEEEQNEEGEYTGVVRGTLLPWIYQARAVCQDYGVDPQPYIDDVMDRVLDYDGIGIDTLFTFALKHFQHGSDERGDSMTEGAIFAEIAKECGYDGVIMDANRHFGNRRGYLGGKIDGMAGVTDGVLHIVPFEPEQIKSFTGNTGTFSDDSRDIRFRLRMPPVAKKESLLERTRSLFRQIS